LNIVKNWPGGVQQDFDPKVREALEELKSRIVIETSDKIIGKWDVKWESTAACKTMMPLLVARINTISGPNFNEDSFLALLEFSKKQMNSRHSQGYATAYVICSLLNVLEETSQLDSKLAMFLWAHSAYVKKNSFGKRHDQDTEKLIKSAWEKLSKLESKLILHFLPFVENNKLENKLLLRAESHLESIGPNFVRWYYNGNTERTKNLLAFARGCETTWKNEILRQLQVEVVRTQQTYTFESFILYNMIKHCPKIRKYTESVYYSSAPDCAVLLLAQDESAKKSSGDGAYHIRLVNKLFPYPVGTHEEKAVCSRLSPNQRFNAIVDPKSALIKFNVQPGNTSLQIDQDEKTVNFTKDGTEWKVMAVDQQHVKIFTEAGKKFKFIHNIIRTSK